LLRRGLEHVEDAGKQTIQQVTQGLQAAGLVKPQPPAYDPNAWSQTYVRHLRPPGAVAEWRFPETCSRCGLCVQACPAHAIKLDPLKAGGYPYIVAREQPCVVCDDLACMKACPTGTLSLLPRERIRIGLAVVDHHTCLRCDWDEQRPKQDCRQCIEVCPFGESAIGLDSHGLSEVRSGCVGCGLCEHKCPTQPASIWVEERYDHDYDHDNDSHPPAPRPRGLTRAALVRHHRLGPQHGKPRAASPRPRRR
jgi:MauM/NapG family ferredoxin protein